MKSRQILQWAISSQDSLCFITVSKVQRLTVYHGVHSNEWKWGTTLIKVEDIVSTSSES
jgi:hypothetical protein